MSFASPGWLLLLVAVAALLVGYLLVQRSRRRVAARFTSVDLLASVAPRRPGWRRHLSIVALLGALAALVIGFAHPSYAERVPRKRATVILALDTSGSMAATDVRPDRLAAAKAEARRFAAALPSGVQLGLLSFATNTQLLVSPTTDRNTLIAGIDSLQLGAGTDTAGAIDLALRTIAAQPPAAGGKRAPAAIVLMSDGTPTVAPGNVPAVQAALAAATSAGRAKVPIDTIAFGTAGGTVTIEGQVIPVPVDPAVMAKIAADSGGRTYAARSGGELRSVYQDIGRAVGYVTHRRSLTGWFEGIGFALAALGVAASLLWTQRVV